MTPGPARSSGREGRKPMPGNTSGAWDLIVAPWHLDEHIPDFPVPVGTVATIGPPPPDGSVPSRMTVLHRAVADAVAGAARPPGALASPHRVDGRLRSPADSPCREPKS